MIRTYSHEGDTFNFFAELLLITCGQNLILNSLLQGSLCDYLLDKYHWPHHELTCHGWLWRHSIHSKCQNCANKSINCGNVCSFSTELHSYLKTNTLSKCLLIYAVSCIPYILLKLYMLGWHHVQDDLR